MRLLYDEGHNQTWTIDPTLASQLSQQTNEAPRYYSYAHVVELVRRRFGGAVTRLTTAPWSAAQLAGADVLVLNHCCASSHRHRGVGGEAVFSASEIAALVAAVENGLGLLVLGEFEIDHWGSNINQVLAPFGLAFANDVATVAGTAGAAGVAGEPASDLRLPIFETSCVMEHPATAGVRKISYGSGCTLRLTGERTRAVVGNGEGAVLLAAAEHGRGRVIAVGDSDLFAEPYVSYNDNCALLLGLVSWLSGHGPIGPICDIGHLGDATAPSAVHTAHETAHEMVAQGLTVGEGPAPGTVVDLGAAERDEMVRLLPDVSNLSNLSNVTQGEDFEAFALEAKLVFHELPKRLRRALVEFAQRGNVDGALLLRGLPQDPWVPPTPTRSGERPAKPTAFSELWLCAVAAALGEPVGYLQEKQGRIFQDIYPTPANADKLSSESSSILLDFHTEIAFHPFMPDYVLLYGLRQDPGAEARTIFSSVRRFVHLLEPADRDLLFANLFHTGVDYSFGNTAELSGVGPLVSVLYGDRLDPFLRYDLDLMVGQTPAARRALQVVRELVNRVKKDVVIEPGCLLVIDNRRAVHARSHFTAHYDGRDRWLQRVSVVRDLDASLGDRLRGTRVIATDFSHYLAPAASALEVR